MTAFRPGHCYSAGMRKTAIFTLTAFMALVPASAVAKNTTPKGGGHTPVTICHHAGPTKTITITVDDDAVAKHVSQHGDTIGPCPVEVTPPPVVTPPDTPPTPPATPVTPTAPETPSTPTPPVACEGGPPVTIRYTDGEVISTKPGCGETVYINVDRKPEPKPGQIVAPDRAKGHKPHAQVVARVRAQQKALVQRVAVARAQQELPHTGFPAGLLALLGASTLAGGFALRRKLGLQK